MVVVAKEIQAKEVFRNVEMMVSLSSLRRGSRLVQLTIRVWSTGHLAPTESSVEGREAGLGNCSVSIAPPSGFQSCTHQSLWSEGGCWEWGEIGGRSQGLSR